MNEIFLLLVLIVTPLLLVFLKTRIKIIRVVSPVLIAYVLGVVFSLIDFNTELSVQIKENVTFVSALLALPLLIISNNINDIFKQLGKSLLVGFLGFISLTVVILLSYYLFQDEINELWKISGILFGLYTGGTPNMVAIQTALKLDTNIFLTLTISDMAITALFLLFAIVLMKVLNKNNDIHVEAKTDLSKKCNNHKYNYLVITAITIGIVGVSYVISNFLFSDNLTVAIIILITSFSIIIPFVVKSYNKDSAYNLGNVFIVIFSFGVSSMMDISTLNFDGLWILLYVATVLLSTFVLHLLLAKIFKIDLDFVIVVAVSLICSPAFVPLIIGYAKNKALLIPGISIGILGYVVGNYLGISVAFFLK